MGLGGFDVPESHVPGTWTYATNSLSKFPSGAAQLVAQIVAEATALLRLVWPPQPYFSLVYVIIMKKLITTFLFLSLFFPQLYVAIYR